MSAKDVFVFCYKLMWVLFFMFNFLFCGISVNINLSGVQCLEQMVWQKVQWWKYRSSFMKSKGNSVYFIAGLYKRATIFCIFPHLHQTLNSANSFLFNFIFVSFYFNNCLTLFVLVYIIHLKKTKLWTWTNFLLLFNYLFYKKKI